MPPAALPPAAGRRRFSVAILHHHRAPRRHQENYLLSFVAERWRRRHAIDVRHVYGVSYDTPADLAILHVDLSVVPTAYADLARRYPVALNAGVTDIRKRAVSALLLADPADFDGPVIVKTDLNAGGAPERKVGEYTMPPVFRKLRRQLRKASLRLGRASHAEQIAARYRVYPTAAEVPDAIYSDPALVVEKFVPERCGRFYCQRRYYFLGDAEVNQLWLGTAPICFNDIDGVEHVEEAPVPPDIRAFRRRFGIDFGKIDYVLGEKGEAIVLDVNKTPSGACRNPAHRPWLHRLCETLETGLSSVRESGQPLASARAKQLE
jgi:hypothetical protein